MDELYLNSITFTVDSHYVFLVSLVLPPVEQLDSDIQFQRQASFIMFSFQETIEWVSRKFWSAEISVRRTKKSTAAAIA